MDRMRKLTVRLLVGLALLWALLLLYPVRTGFYRAGILLTFAGWYLCLAVILWRHRRVRWIPVAIPAALGVFLLLPGRAADTAALRAAYVSSLRSYAGTRYVWGGENWFGVDCSGLLRAALVDAHFREAVRTLNPALARHGLWFWWHDESARDMCDGYLGLSLQLDGQKALKDVPAASLLPGDLAVTADGSHVLAYVGEGRWIEADPYTMRVIELGPGVESGWWGMKVVPCRWRCMGDEVAVRR